MISRRAALALAAIVAGAAALAGCAKPSGPPAELKFGHVVSADHPYGLGAQKFAELIEQRTGGRIKIEVYPAGQLGSGERQLLESLQTGTVDLAVTATGPISGFSESMMILDLPFLFRDNAHVDEVLDGPIGRGLLDDLERSGIKGLAFWENGFRHVTNGRKPVRSPEDVRGMKIRLMENPVHMDTFRALGADPTPMQWGEVYTALQQGTVDGQENPIPIIYYQKIYEVQKHLSLTGHFYSPAPITMSLARFKEMSPGDRELFLETAREVAKYERALVRDNEEKLLKEIEDHGMAVATDVDRSVWQAATKSVYEKYGSKFGKDRVQAIIDTK